MKKIAFIGAGRMAEALIGGLLKNEALGADEIVISDVDVDRRDYFTSHYQIQAVEKNSEAASRAEFVLLAVKPQHINSVVEGLKGVLDDKKTIVSIAAGIPISRIRSILGAGVPVVRVMPNAPALVNRGVSALVVPNALDPAKRAFIEQLFKAVGTVVYVEEESIDAVTAVSGSGPAYFFLFVSALAAAGVKNGLSPQTALHLARQTFVGSGLLLEASGRSEDELIAAVASPGGTTEAAIRVFTDLALEDTVAKAVDAACARAGELSKG